MKSTIGEIIFATVISCVAAVLAAIAGGVGTIAVCAKLLQGETSEWVLVLAPAVGLLLAAAVFIIVFRKIITYGERPT